MGDFDISAAAGIPASADNVISPKTRIHGNGSTANSGLCERTYPCVKVHKVKV